MNYVELQATSNFSFLHGASHPEEYVATAAALGLGGIAVADHNSFAGIVRAHSEAKRQGVRYIVATHIIFEEASLPYSLLLYPEDKAAYSQLCQLLTRGKMRAPKGKCYLTPADVFEFCRGVHAALYSKTPWEIAAQDLLGLKEAFNNDHLSLVINRCYQGQEDRRLATLSTLSAQFNIPLLITSDALYHCPERRQLQDVVTCIRHSTTLEDAGFLLEQNAERHLKPITELARLHRGMHHALERSKQIADCLSFSLDQLRYEYPEEVCPANTAPIAHLRQLVESHAAKRYPQGLPIAVEQQLEHELELIHDLDYAKYFLTVYDIVSFARRQNILCQGRGAAANSAVCYVLGITAVDPSTIRLLVERFISKERNEPPDIDIDFEHERREEVIQYVYNKYGRMRAALVCAVITYRSKSAFREVAKAFCLDETAMLALRKMYRNSKTENGEAKITAQDFLHYGLNPDDQRLWHCLHLALELRRFPRHLTQHVGGFVISKPELSTLVPIAPAAMAERSVIEWDKDDIEALGMLKIDVLALGMLTCIRKAFSLINNTLKEKRVTHGKLLLHTVPPEDPEVYKMISRADTLGVFQIESRAQMSMLPKTRPRTFYELVIQVAIVRPGPIQGGMVHPYIRRRNGLERASFPNEQVKAVLAPTLGVPIFQEQIMELAVICAGFTPGEADELRRAMASWKRKGNLLEKFGKRMINGMLAKGYQRSFAQRVFNQIKGFSEYGFPQSHAASFAHLVYLSCWLKHHYPEAFAAALINSQPMGFYSAAQIISDAKNHGVNVLPIDVAHSGWDCHIDAGKTLRLGLRLVRGIAEQEAKLLASYIAKRGKPNSLQQLWQESSVRVSTLRQLAHADAFASFGLSRQDALWEIKRYRDDPLPLFANHTPESSAAALPELSPAVEVFKDYQTTGFSLRAHPVAFLRQQLAANGITPNAELHEENLVADKERRAVTGLVIIRQQPQTASGIVFMTLEDETGIINVVVKPDILQQDIDAVRESTLAYVSGQVQREQTVTHLIAESVVDCTALLKGLHAPSRDFH